MRDPYHHTMSTYREPAWSQDICDLVETKDEGGIPGTTPQLPMFDYLLVSPPNMADIPDWSSPDCNAMLSENNYETGPQTHPPASVFSASSSNGPEYAQFEPSLAKQSSLNSSLSAKVKPTDKVSKAKPQRTKELSAKEAELMEKDDAQLSESDLVLKKKAINRLAQRAFRERKESKLKELQAELLQSESERQKLLDHLEEFKRQFICMRTENQMLRSGRVGKSAAQENTPVSQQAFIEQMMQGQIHVVDNSTINKVYPEPKNPARKVLGVGALWDYLQLKREEEEYENVDMLDLMAILKGNELCHGYGPAYALDLVEDALKQVAAKANSN